MINRKALWICLLLVFAMIAADLWRLSLLADWHHVPLDGPGNSRTLSVLRMFSPPLAVLFTIGALFTRQWLRSGSEEAMRSWRRYYDLALVFNTGIVTLMQAFLLARSLGALQSVDRVALGHVILVVTGVFVMLVGNMLPKMPFLTARFRPFQLDPWQWNRHLRFAGRITVALGLLVAVVMPLLPVKMFLPAMLGLALTSIAVNLWHRAKVKREPSPQP